MANDLLIQGSGPMQLPAHLAGTDIGVTNNLMEGMYSGGNRIGLKGSRFRLVVNGIEEGVIEEPYLDTIILGAAPAISRVYYKGAYKPGENASPTCYSADGITPADDVHTPQSDKCATCPQNIKGSKIVEGAKYKACAYFRRVVIMLAGDTEDRRVFKLDVKGQGLFGESTANEKNLNDYIKMIATRGVDAGALVTRVSFDTDASVPKLLFKAVRYITEEELAAVNDLVHGEEVTSLKHVNMSTIDLSNEEPTSGDSAEEESAPQATKQTVKPAPQAIKPTPQAVKQAAKPTPQVAKQTAKPTVQSNVAPPSKQQTVNKAASKPEQKVEEVESDDDLEKILSELE